VTTLHQLDEAIGWQIASILGSGVRGDKVERNRGPESPSERTFRASSQSSHGSGRRKAEKILKNKHKKEGENGGRFPSNLNGTPICTSQNGLRRSNPKIKDRQQETLDLWTKKKGSDRSKGKGRAEEAATPPASQVQMRGGRGK